MARKLNHELFRPEKKKIGRTVALVIAALSAATLAAALVSNWERISKTEDERYRDAIISGDFDLALGIAQSMVEKDPASPEAQRALAAAYLQKALRQQGLPLSLELGASAVRAAEKIDPSNPENAYLLGLAFELGGDLKGAEQEYLKAVNLQPKNVAYLLRLAALHEKTKKNSAALDIYRRATVADPKSGQARVAYARFLLLQDDAAGALEQASLAAEDSDSAVAAEANRILSLALLSSGELPEARLAAERAVELDPDSALALVAYGDTLMAGLFSSAGAGRFEETVDEALALANRAISLNPNLASAYFLGYRAAYSQKDRAAAREYSRQVLRRLSSDASLSDDTKNEIRLLLKNAQPVR